MSTKKKLIREHFRNEVLARDKNKCKFCTCTEDLDAHHIIDRHELPAGGYVKENGISLCPEHHRHAEVWHSTNGREFVEGMKPEDLFKKIFSSYEHALAASKKLENKLSIGDK